jgi:hypothetical protein
MQHAVMSESRMLDGLREMGGTKMATQRGPKIQGAYNIQILSSLWDRNEQADSIPDTVFVTQRTFSNLMQSLPNQYVCHSAAMDSLGM